MTATNGMNIFRNELEKLFNILCDGLFQEVYLRQQATIQSGAYDFTLTKERGEQGIIPLLGAHLHNAGFIVKYESYYFNVSKKLRPDLRIWLPVNKKNIFLEVKMTAWGDSGDGYYWIDSIDDMNKIDPLTGENSWNGFLAFGFSKTKESPNQLDNRFSKLSSDITAKFTNYEEIGLRRIDLQSMDLNTSYAVIGLWFRKQ
jgi:hypothetical protein